MGRYFPFFNNNSSKNGAIPIELRRSHPIPLRKSEDMLDFRRERLRGQLELCEEVVRARNFEPAALLNV